MPRIHQIPAIVASQSTEFATTSGSGASVNTLGYSNLALNSTVTTNASATVTLQLQTASDNATWANIANATITVPLSTTAGAAMIGVNMKNPTNLQYVRCVYTLNQLYGGSGGTCNICNNWLTTNPQQWPTSDTIAAVNV